MTSWTVESLGPESRKAHARRVREDFFYRYFGGVVLDIGYRGYEDQDVMPVLQDAIGIDLDYPGYDGKRLPFDEGSVDTVYASHTLEHITDPSEAIQEWFRVLRVGGYLVLAVPHQFLYEKRSRLPSRWNEDHKRFYTPAKLLAEVEAALTPNSYRVRRLIDDDEDYNYSIPPSQHAGGAYQIELVLQKIQPPTWTLEDPPEGSATPEAAQPGLEEINAQLANVFSELKSAVKVLSDQNSMAARRLALLAGQFETARRELDAALPSPTGANPLADYLRPDAVPTADIVTTTRFFRNRRQLKTLLARLQENPNPVPQVLVAGTSRGCEAYSLAIEAQLAGLDLDITAIDIDSANIEEASRGWYSPMDFVDFDGSSLMTKDVAKFFSRNGNQVQIRKEALRCSTSFEVADLFSHDGLYDAIICNNVLIHFARPAAERALTKLDLSLVDGGILAVGGVPQDVLVKFMTQRTVFAPLETAMEEIWEDWKGDRQSWKDDPGSYVGMPPIDRSLADWKIRFCTLFLKTGLGMGDLAASPEALGMWVGGAGAALHKATEWQTRIASNADAITEYLDDLLA